MAETYGPPTRQQAVNSATGGNRIVDKLFDAVTGALSRVGAVEMERYELSRLAELRAVEARAGNQRQMELSGEKYTQQQKMLIGGASALAIVMLGAAAVLAARR